MFHTELFLQRLNRIAMFLFSNSTIFSNNTGFTVFEIIAVLFLPLAISIVGKISFCLRYGPHNIVFIAIWPGIKKNCTPLQ